MTSPKNTKRLRELMNQILQNDRKVKHCLALEAAALHEIKNDKLYRTIDFFEGHAEGFQTWKAYINWMRCFHHVDFSGLRQADRYVFAVQVWVKDLGYDLETLSKYGPSRLGVLAQTGKIRSHKTAEQLLAYIDEGWSQKAVLNWLTDRPIKKSAVAEDLFPEVVSGYQRLKVQNEHLCRTVGAVDSLLDTIYAHLQLVAKRSKNSSLLRAMTEVDRCRHLLSESNEQYLEDVAA